MAQVNLGQVRDKITSIQRTSGDGTAGSTDIYTIYTECSPTGAGTFTVKNGINGAGRLAETVVAESGLPAFVNTIGPQNVVAILARQQVDEGVYNFTQMSVRYVYHHQEMPADLSDDNVEDVELFFPNGTQSDYSENIDYTVVYNTVREDTAALVVDVGTYATTDAALTAIQNAVYANSSAFENGEKYVAQNSDQTVITVVGCSGTHNRILIGHVSDFTGEDDAYFFAAEPAANNTWKMTKYGIDNSPKSIGTTPLYDIDVRSQIRSATSGTIDMPANFSIFDGGNFYVCSFYCSGAHPTVGTSYNITLNLSLPNNNWICVTPLRMAVGNILLAKVDPPSGSFIYMQDAEISFAANTNHAQRFEIRLTVSAMGASGGSYFGGMFMLPKFDALN